MRVVEVIPPSSHLRFTASQEKLDWNLAESQNLARESGENSRRKVQNVVTDSSANGNSGLSSCKLRGASSDSRALRKNERIRGLRAGCLFDFGYTRVSGRRNVRRESFQISRKGRFTACVMRHDFLTRTHRLTGVRNYVGMPVSGMHKSQHPWDHRRRIEARSLYVTSHNQARICSQRFWNSSDMTNFSITVLRR